MPMTAAQRLIQFNKIAVLTDLERDSEKLLRYAGSLGRWYGSQLLLVHGCSADEHVDRREPSPHWPTREPQLKEEDEKKLWTLSQKFHLQDLVSKVLIRQAGIGELLRELEECRPNLIVIASHGREGVRKWLAGSVCEEVFRTVQWPVLVLGPCAAEEDPGAQKQFTSILYATDMSAISVSALQYAAGIAHDHDAQLTALYVDEKPEESFSFDRAMALQRLDDWLQDHVDGLAGALGGVRPVVESGKAETAIVQAAAERRADLIVLGARGLRGATGLASHFVGGTAYEVVCAAKCPVLIVQQPR
ncbi:MAG TPA: universal stress protein [Candidatus Angelobacter sp.]